MPLEAGRGCERPVVILSCLDGLCRVFDKRDSLAGMRRGFKFDNKLIIRAYFESDHTLNSAVGEALHRLCTLGSVHGRTPA